jgi:hypothetical protein
VSAGRDISTAPPEGLIADEVLGGGPTLAALDAALLAAHAADDRCALIGLYADAAEVAADTAAAFYLTHAFVFALEAGDPRATALKARLVALGADLPDAAQGA